jgi:hypothetical protein
VGLAACQARPAAPALSDAFPSAGVVQGWTPAGEVETFDSETIFSLVDGQADFFFAYGFQQVAVRRYQNAAGVKLNVELWQLATPADAYGLFTAGISGMPASIGRANDADAEAGRRLAFWQDRYTVQVRALQPVADAELQSFAQVLSDALPAGGEPPALVERLPPGGLVVRSALFFRQEISIQDQVWLGGENALGLNQDTAGVLARYNLNGRPAHLLLVEYPNAKAASAGLLALEGSRVEGLVAAGARDALLAAVLGELDEAAAAKLLAEALGNGPSE